MSLSCGKRGRHLVPRTFSCSGSTFFDLTTYTSTHSPLHRIPSLGPQQRAEPSTCSTAVEEMRAQTAQSGTLCDADSTISPVFSEAGKRVGATSTPTPWLSPSSIVTKCGGQRVKQSLLRLLCLRRLCGTPRVKAPTKARRGQRPDQLASEWEARPTVAPSPGRAWWLPVPPPLIYRFGWGKTVKEVKRCCFGARMLCAMLRVL